MRRRHALPFILPVATLASALAACATAEETPLTLAPYPANAQPDATCLSTMRQAGERQARGEFQLLGREVRRIVGPSAGGAHAAAGNAPMPASVLPEGSHPVALSTASFDNTFTLMYVNCTTRQAWFSKRGGVIDASHWFGPFAL